jgi:hypothetical protein
MPASDGNIGPPLYDGPEQVRENFGGMLQIRIHHPQNLSPRCLPPIHHRSCESTSTFTPYHMEARILFGHFLCQLPGFIGTVIIDKEDFEVEPFLLQNGFDPPDQRTDIEPFVIGRNHEGKHIHLLWEEA